MVLLFYPITVDNFEKLTVEVAIFYMDSYGTAGKNKSSRVVLKRDQIFDQYKTYDFEKFEKFRDILIMNTNSRRHMHEMHESERDRTTLYAVKEPP